MKVLYIEEVAIRRPWVVTAWVDPGRPSSPKSGAQARVKRQNPRRGSG